MNTILITGFEPFGGDAANPTQDIAAALNGRWIAGCPVVGATLPCVFRGAERELLGLLRRYEPQFVVGLGLAGNRTEITPERVAINVDDARIPDNAGRQPVDRPVVAGGPVAYWSRLPCKAIVAEGRRRGLPVAVSQSAGTFVCNHVFYVLMHTVRRRPAVRAGFIHVPWPAEAAAPIRSTASLADLTAAIELAAKLTVRRRRDARGSAGAVA